MQSQLVFLAYAQLNNAMIMYQLSQRWRSTHFSSWWDTTAWYFIFIGHRPPCERPEKPWIKWVFKSRLPSFRTLFVIIWLFLLVAPKCYLFLWERMSQFVQPCDWQSIPHSNLCFSTHGSWTAQICGPFCTNLDHVSYISMKHISLSISSDADVM